MESQEFENNNNETKETSDVSESLDTFETSESSELPESSVEEIAVQEESNSNESTDVKPENANTTNCLALTIQKDHKIVAVKNVFLRSVRMSWKVVVSAITLALIKLFS